jgi:integrase
MASIGKDPGGRKRILFVAPDGSRKTLRLGKASMDMATKVKIKVESLLSSILTGHALDGETACWVAELDKIMADRLASVGLIPKRQSAKLATFLDSFIESRTDVKPRTKLKYKAVRESLVGFFGEDRKLRTIAPGEADDWRLKLLDGGLVENTVRKQIAVAKLFFTAAKRKRLIPENPFSDLKAAIRANVSRFFFVSREDAQKVIDACPDAQWRLLFALSRYGGLRCPSEHLALRWEDVNWGNGRLTVHSPKTEHHAGGESRVIPIFPELRPYLEDVFEQAAGENHSVPGTEYVITRYRDCNANLRTQLNRIIRKAGQEPWPKLFQNLRSTRETELAETYPMHVVCKWIGNTEPVAAKHYLQVTDAHFERAIRDEESAAQNPAQYTPKMDRKGRESESRKPAFPAKYERLRPITPPKVAAVGLEPTTRGL